MANKGYGVELNNVVLIGGLALLGYVAYKVISPLTNGLGQSASGVGSAIGGVGQGIGSIGTSTSGLYSDLAQNTSNIAGQASGVISTGLGIVSATESKVANVVGNMIAGGGSSPPVQPINISSASNDVARAQAAATYSGGTYNANTGVLIVDNKGYSVAPGNVPAVIAQAKSYTNPSTGSTITRGAGSFLSNKGFG